MILVLSVRFRKYIALFLYSIFYSQLLLAAGQAGVSGARYAGAGRTRHSAAAVRVPRVHALDVSSAVASSGPSAVRLADMRTVGSDSPINPSRNRQMPDLTSSPSFRPLVTPLAAQQMQPGAIVTPDGVQTKADIGGPSQPEMQSFQSVNSNNMVDLFTGDFSYNIPLLDVGGYPVNISYHSGRSMDEDASWVGLGWNINPGSITRDMRGLPDDFSGGADTVRKVANIKANTTVGIKGGADIELMGLPIGLGASTGIFNNTYNGWGAEIGLNASINAGAKSSGAMTSELNSTDNNSTPSSDSSSGSSSSSLSGSLGITDNSQSGITINPSLSYQFQAHEVQNIGSPSAGVQLSSSYNSRAGLKDIQLGLTLQSMAKINGQRRDGTVSTHDFDIDIPTPSISFTWPTYTPTISLPMTNRGYTFTVKLGGEVTATHPSFFLSGYLTKEYVAAADTSLSLPAYGYLNFQNRGNAWTALMDFNREKELPYRENPPVPHIAIPAYTYDVFTIAGEGTGGMFRAYRGDIGFIADHQISNKTQSDAASVDLGGGAIAHGGVDLNVNFSTTTSGPWLSENPLRNTINFRPSNGLYEAAYFRNPGEKAINTTDFYNAIGGDYVAVAGLYQNNSSITTTNTLNLFNGGESMGSTNLTDQNAARTTRDKRAQVITYLTAGEASVSGLDKYIRRYGVNQFGHYCENDTLPDAAGPGTGLVGYYFKNQALQGQPDQIRYNQNVFNQWQNAEPFNFSSLTGSDHSDLNFPEAHWSTRWLGRYKAPASGTYRMGFWVDDGVRFWIDDSLLINDWRDHGNIWDTCRVNLVAGKLYNIRIEYYQDAGSDQLEWSVRRPDTTYTKAWYNAYDSVPRKLLYPPVFTDTMSVNPIVTAEDRVNSFRKPNHISEIDVLNPDGRRYVYGIPVYNLVQKEVSFSVNSNSGNIQTGLTAYSPQDNSPYNTEGKDGYYSREEIPAYAHSFLLTGILSPDYVDVTGDGISDDDLGDAVRFDYSKTSGIANPYGWRAPYVTDSATYNEGFRSYNRDDKAHYIYGTKELWYLHTIESKTMIATFTLQSRSDLLGVDENGDKIDSSKGMCLKQIDLYSKADWLKYGTAAVPIKTVHFVYDYSLCPGVNSPVDNLGKLTLRQIWFTYNGNNKGILNPYIFNYHNNNPGYRVNMSDKWGTYKNPAQNPGATSSNPITNAEYPYAIQDSATAAYNAGAWTLDSITLPSGGRIKVNYESDDYAYVQNRRSTLMCKIAGIGTDTSGQNYTNRLYNFLNILSGSNDGLYIYVKVPYSPVSDADLYARYLAGITRLYFRLYVGMPKDAFGSGSEYIPCYADPDSSLTHWYGVLPNQNIIWIKVKGVNSSATGSGNLSPLAQTAINFLRMNLPDKAYPGSELPDNLSAEDLIKIALSMVTNITGLLMGFTNTARSNGWASTIDTSRSFVRLDCPNFKKYGGGLRVQSILIYDNWNAMTHQKETVYGQNYNYTTTTSVNGVPTTISSGVASWEPGVGAEENPFHLPIEYVERTSVLAPAAMQYTEEPLGESFYPGPSIGYSRVRVRSIHTTGTRSANGYAESTFYTTYDFPTSWDYSQLDNNSKKRYKPLLSNFLRINVQNYLTLSQGFKVELNDMNGKQRTEATYSETDTVHPLSYTENFYKVDNQNVQFKHLNNTVTTIDPLGNINTSATIGKDAEMMGDMRDQTTNVTGANINLNVDMFSLGPWPVIMPSLLNLYQHETDRFRSVALTKIIQRYGILDSVVHIDKGSKISTKNLLYDAETGEALLTRTQNEFNDSVFQFAYPAHWVYSNIGPAYQNVDAVLTHLQVDHGKIVGGLTSPDTSYLTAGDELLVASRQTISGSYCDSAHLSYSSFPDSFKLWVVDTSLIAGGPRSLYIMDQYGTPFSGNDVSIKVTRSGYRNQNSNIGSVTSLANPLVANGQGVYHLVFDSTRQVINAAANELQQIWRVSDKRRSNILTSCIFTTQDSATAALENCSCLKPFFDYLISTGGLYQISLFRRQTVGSIAAAAGINLNSCPLLANQAGGYFRTATPDRNSPLYEAYLGNVLIKIAGISGAPMNLASMTNSTCNAQGQVIYKNPNLVAPPPDTVTMNIYPVSYANLISGMSSSGSDMDSLEVIDSVTDHLLVENDLSVNGVPRNAASELNFGRLDWKLPAGVSNIVSAQLILTADRRGHYPPQYLTANSINTADTVGVSLVSPAGWFPNQMLDSMLYQAYYAPYFKDAPNGSSFQNLTVDLTDYVNGYINGYEPTYNSASFLLTQGGGNLNSGNYDSSMVAQDVVPPYLMNGSCNYYATYYSTRYPDSTKWPVLQVKYLNYSTVDTLGAVLAYNATEACTTVVGRSCYSSVTDTLVNPYQYGLLGDYRPVKSYVYYGRRAETDPSQPTNIRTNGVISSFAPFWTLQPSGHWGPSYDSTRWVWNSQTTLYNRKGFELENKDPLGRYNSGIYGYDLTLPVAVTQNSRYQESAYEGFEDYGFTSNSCDTTCAEARPFDFSAYSANISDSAAHTGQYSLRVPAGGTISLIGLPVAATPDADNPTLSDTLSPGPGGGLPYCNTFYDGSKASAASVLPPFKPFSNKQMLIGAWVKEEDSCSCQTYSNDHLIVSFTLGGGGDSTVNLLPSGNMIEGWQRYEAIVHIPATATAITLTLQASGSSTTYFDDIRLHPFNAEMKSYVYNSTTLRLMAELDENNYATFYEYDDDGTLIRVKKETERGVMTIKETRSALMKNQ